MPTTVREQIKKWVGGTPSEQGQCLHALRRSEQVWLSPKQEKGFTGAYLPTLNGPTSSTFQG